VADDTWMRQAKELMLLQVYEGRPNHHGKEPHGVEGPTSERKESRKKALNQAALLVEHAEGKAKSSAWRRLRTRLRTANAPSMKCLCVFAS
jgi:hypothetical protein